MIDVIDLTKTYDGTDAVRGLTLHVERGEIVGLVGPNGAGKTTTLRCLAGIIPPTAGRVAIAGHDLSGSPIEARRHLAFVPDEPHLFDYLTAWEHLLVLARVYRVEDAETRARDLLSHFDLLDRRHAFPGELSRGMKQKLMIAGALLHRPQALILDEPLTGLDPRAMRQMKDTVVEVAAAGTAVLVSSHMLHLVEEISTRICIIHRGRKVMDDSLAAIRAARPELGESADLEDIFLHATRDEAEV
jgi:ABC-2 type transport system ATP-binding protein